MTDLEQPPPCDTHDPVHHPDGGWVAWNQAGWYRQPPGGADPEPVMLGDALAWCDTEEHRNQLVRCHGWGVKMAAHRRDWSAFLRLVDDLVDACELWTTAMVADDIGVKAKTVAGYASDGTMGPAARQPGQGHGRVHLWTRRQHERWKASRPGRAWRRGRHSR